MTDEIGEKYITAKELTEIARLLEAYEAFWQATLATKDLEISWDDTQPQKLYDTSGECVGAIGIGEPGAVFYLAKNDE